MAHMLTRYTVREIGGNYQATFAESLKIIHIAAKKEINLYDFACTVLRERGKNDLLKNGIKEMHYSEYKNDYSDCRTVKDSYDKKSKTIQVYVGAGSAKNMNGVCPHCGTYCYGDCQVNRA